VKVDDYPEQYVRAALQTCKGKINTFDELPAYCGFYFTMILNTNLRAQQSISLLKTNRGLKPFAMPSVHLKNSTPQKSKPH
jgi:hypothetical protein